MLENISQLTQYRKISWFICCVSPEHTTFMPCLHLDMYGLSQKHVVVKVTLYSSTSHARTTILNLRFCFPLSSYSWIIGGMGKMSIYSSSVSIPRVGFTGAKDLMAPFLLVFDPYSRLHWLPSCFWLLEAFVYPWIDCGNICEHHLDLFIPVIRLIILFPWVHGTVKFVS